MEWYKGEDKPAGTLREIYAGGGHATPYNLANVNGTHFCIANDDRGGLRR